MNPLKIIPLLIALVSPFIPMSALAAGKHALLIGIQDYSQTGFRSLKGPANDLKLMAGVLRERFGFQDDDFMIIKDDRATHTGIENAFNALIKRVNPGDFVYIYYSGHGSRTADLNGDEPSGLDQTWVSYGARTTDEAHQDNYDVLDDEIGTWLAALYAKTKKVVFVSDSCHSATVSRGPAVPTRAVKADKRPHLLGKRTYTRPTTQRGIRVGAARDDESSIEEQMSAVQDDEYSTEFQKQSDQYYGLFTWYWAQSLQQAQAGNTWNDVFKQTYAQVTAYKGLDKQADMPQPQMEGERQLVWYGDFTPLPQRIPVYYQFETQVKLLVGSLAGVTEGSVYRLYKPQHLGTLPRLTIIKVTPFASYAKPEPETRFKTGDLVIEESHKYDFAPIKVYLAADFPDGKDKPLLQAIRAAFQPRPDKTLSFPAYKLTDDPYKADLQLYILRPKRENGQLIRAQADDTLPKSFSNQPPQLWVLTPAQRLLNEKLQMSFDKPENNHEEGIKLLRENLNKLARIREFKQLQSSGSRALADAVQAVAVQVLILTPDSACQTGANCMLLPDSSLGWHRKKGPYHLQDIDGRVNKGDLLAFTLHNKSKQDYYCYVISLRANGAIYTIFPDPDENMESARLNAGKTKVLMEEVVLPMEEVGEDIIKVITSTSPIQVSLLEQRPFDVRGQRLNPLERLLLNAMYGWREGVSIENDEWATEQVIVDVK
ncbi:MAG: hypothetical protein DRR19_06815 [Candidatus Parabeggiatoa sp. nov. 1]|nr:MAG: hypothetical protein DRR19_06815 [Gammaproteobacteria bacterium]